MAISMWRRISTGEVVLRENYLPALPARQVWWVRSRACSEKPLGTTFSLMVLLCLNCASADCTCGRLARLVSSVNQTDHVAHAACHAQEPVFGSIDCAAERVDAAAELEALFVRNPRDD
jgi:hypothetical protein